MDEVWIVFVIVLFEEYFFMWGFYISVWFDKLSFKNKNLCINMCIKNEIVKGDGGGGKYLYWIIGSLYFI